MAEKRSPQYPSINLREAVERVGLLHVSIGRSPTNREVVAKGMGYSGLSGSAATAISALKKYGLVEGRNEDIRVSDRAMAILHPHSDAEKRQALIEAANGPELFKELTERVGAGPLNEELLRNYLMRNGYTPTAVDPAISAYRETIEFVRGLGPAYDSASKPSHEAESMSFSTEVAKAWAPRPSPEMQAFRAEAPKGMKEDVFTLSEGDVVLRWPEALTEDSFEDLEAWTQLMLRKIKKSIVGKSNVEKFRADLIAKFESMQDEHIESVRDPEFREELRRKVDADRNKRDSDA